ncbi:MAG TPA: carbohydrate-binding family 9-like protein [Pyrinomonadaceae bacterium]
MTAIDPSTTVVARYFAHQLEIEDEQWNACQPVQITHQWSGANSPITRHAEVRLSWNDEALTARFVCAQHELLVVAENPVTTEKSLGLWDRDVCEIFIAPNSNHINDYFEFEAAPTGEWIDIAIHITPTGRESEWDYASGMTTTSKLEANELTVTITIPWSERIPKPASGDEWRANLFRCVGPDESTRYLAWRPTYAPEPNYHVPEAFGVLRFE